MSSDYIATIPISLKDRVGDFAIGVFTYESGVSKWELLNCARPDMAIESVLTSEEHDVINKAIFEHFS